MLIPRCLCVNIALRPISSSMAISGRMMLMDDDDDGDDDKIETCSYLTLGATLDPKIKAKI